MKRLLLAFILGTVISHSAFAQSTNTPPAGSPPQQGGSFPRFLTPEELAEYQTAKKAAVQADPSLATEGNALAAQRRAALAAGTPPTAEERAQAEAFLEKVYAAMIKADKNVAPIIAKIKDYRHQHEGAAGATPPPRPAPAND